MHNRLVEFFPFFQTLLRSKDIGLAFLGEDLRILYASEAFSSMLAVDSERLEGTLLSDFFEIKKSTLKEILRQRSWSGCFLIGEESVTLQWTRTAPIPGKGPGFVVERISALRDTQAEVNTHQKTQLETLGVLASGVAHDLNNILAGILGHVSFLRLSMPLRGSDQESLETIEQGTRQAAQLTKQILEFARGQQIEPNPIRLGSVVSDAIRLIQTSVPSAVQLHTSGLEHDLYVLGDEGQLSQLILNLAINARDAVGQAGEIRIDVAPRNYHDRAHCQELGIAPGEYVLLSVRDTGPGIEEEIREKIFEPFFTTKEDKGTGLGLATVQAIVMAHRGLLSLDSAPGNGTCFEIALPKAEISRTQKVVPEFQPAPPRGSEKILVVDDEEAVRLIMEKSLQHLGYEVIAVSNGVQALEAFAANDIKLVVLDMIMPGMTGDEVYTALRKADPSVRVLIASGYASDDRIREMLRTGARGYIQKPFSVEELADEVRSCLDAGSEVIGSQAA